LLHKTSSFYSLNPNIHHTIEDHEGFSIFLRVPWHFFILLFSNFLFFFLSVAVFNYLWEWLVVGTYPVYVRKTTLLEVRGEKQEVRDYHLWITDFITRLFVGTFISRIRELENCFSTWITRDDHELNVNYGMLKHRNYHKSMCALD